MTAAFTAAAAVAHFAEASPLLTFGLATVALAGLAWIVSFATEQVGQRYGPAVTGVLQSTLGNLPEFFIVIFALAEGNLIVARASILGSIFANALLVLGIVIVAGCHASADGVMRFHTRLPKDNAVLVLLTSFLIVLIGLSAATEDNASHHIEAISIVGAIALLLTYGVWLNDYLRSDLPSMAVEGAPRVSMRLALALLAAAGVGAAFVSDWFVTALNPAVDALNLSQAFAGLVIVAIAGNAVENVVGIQLAARNRTDYALSVILQSPVQIALVLAPVLVLGAPLVGATFTLVLSPILIAVLVLAVLVTTVVVFDAESNWLEGVALIVLYCLCATAFYWG